MRARVLCACLLSTACGGAEPAAPDGSAIDAASDAALPDAETMPERLRDTGLYVDFDARVLAPGVMAYRPAYELWSDGADKARWIALPDGATIDTSDMDFWEYPEGTKLWKEFSRDGRRIETRLLAKNGPGRYDWHMMAYVWNQDESEAVAAPDGVVDALGTEHDVPATGDCAKCHQRMPDIVIGVSAILLDHQGEGANLGTLIRAGMLSDPPPAAADAYFPLPGDPVARTALGYLHANCGNCHHPRSDVMDTVALDLRLRVAELGAVETTPTFVSAVGVTPQRSAPDGITALIEPGVPAASGVHARMTTRDGSQMPPVGTEVPDADGVAAIDAWILSMPPRAAVFASP